MVRRLRWGTLIDDFRVLWMLRFSIEFWRWFWWLKKCRSIWKWELDTCMIQNINICLRTWTINMRCFMCNSTKIWEKFVLWCFSGVNEEKGLNEIVESFFLEKKTEITRARRNPSIIWTLSVAEGQRQILHFGARKIDRLMCLQKSANLRWSKRLNVDFYYNILNLDLPKC